MSINLEAGERQCAYGACPVVMPDLTWEICDDCNWYFCKDHILRSPCSLSQCFACREDNGACQCHVCDRLERANVAFDKSKKGASL